MYQKPMTAWYIVKDSGLVRVKSWGGGGGGANYVTYGF